MAAIGCKVLLVLWGVRLLAQAPDISAIAKKALPAVVTIEGDKGSGAGFIISQDGLIVTCVHVVEGQRVHAIALRSGGAVERRSFGGFTLQHSMQRDCVHCPSPPPCP